MTTLVDLLEDAVGRYGERAALTTHRGFREQAWSYQRLWQAATAVAGHLRRDLGLSPGTPVVVWAPSSPELVATYFGVMMARLVLVPIDATATPAFVARVATTTGAGLVISASPAREPVTARDVSVRDLPFAASGAALVDRPSADDIAEIVFTSGTTGDPKGVVLTHHNITADVDAALGLVPQRSFRLLSLLPLSHMLEQTVGLYAPLALGSTIDYPTSLRGPVLVKEMRRHAVTAMVLVPQVLRLMADNIEREVASQGKESQWARAQRIADRLPMRMRRVLFRQVHQNLGGHLDFVICGGAHLPAELAETWERLGVRVIEGYGATECAPIVAGNTYWDRRPGTVGRPLPGVQARLSPDGEVLAKGPNVSAGYWQNPVATERAFDADGWYRTGDLGEWDDEGRLRLTGRLADRIVLASGLNVYPDDVERVLREQPEVDDCVVVSLPDRTGAATVHAVVIPTHVSESAAGASVDVGEAVRRAGTRLASHQQPTGVTVWPDDDFPRTNLLKVKRHEVVAALGRGVASRPAPASASPPPGDEMLVQVGGLLSQACPIDAAAVTRDSDLVTEIGLDSLGRVELAVLLEDELGVHVEEEALADLDTVDSLIALIQRSPPEAPPASSPTWPRRRYARAVRALLQQAIVFPALRTVTRPLVVRGGEHLADTTGPFLLIANHSSHLDTPLVLYSLPRSVRARTAVAAAADYFYRSRWRGAAATLVLGTFPFSRLGAVRESLERCGELMDDGWAVLIYPEGTRSLTGELSSFRRGIGLLASELGVPVVPIGITGTHAALPKGARRPRPGPVTVRIGEPITVSTDADRAEQVARLERAVASLLSDASEADVDQATRMSDRSSTGSRAQAVSSAL